MHGLNFGAFLARLQKDKNVKKKNFLKLEPKNEPEK